MFFFVLIIAHVEKFYLKNTILNEFLIDRGTDALSWSRKVGKHGPLLISWSYRSLFRQESHHTQSNTHVFHYFCFFRNFLKNISSTLEGLTHLYYLPDKL